MPLMCIGLKFWQNIKTKWHGFNKLTEKPTMQINKMFISKDFLADHFILSALKSLNVWTFYLIARMSDK